LEQARRDRHDLDGAEVERHALAERAAAAEQEIAAAAGSVAETRHRLDHAQEQQALAQRADLAASLRPTLVAGDACPVCAQVVATLPAPLPSSSDADPDAPRRAVAAAERALDEARRREAAAAAARGRIAAESERLDATVVRLTSALQGVLPGRAGAVPGAEIDAALARLDRLAAASDEAATAVRGARRSRDEAAAGVEELRAEVAAATAGLRAARDPLVPLGVPAVADGDVVGGWTALVAWARQAAEERAAGLPSAQEAVAAAERHRHTAEESLAAADRAAAERRRDETSAARAEQDARGAVETIERRTAQLEAALADAPSDAEAAEELTRLDALDVACREADAQLRGARAALRSAERTADDVGREVRAAWEGLRQARDPLVPLGAPAVSGDELLAGWQALTGWAQREAAVRTERLAEAERAAQSVREARDAVERRIGEDLLAHQVTAAPPLGTSAPAAVAAVLARSRSAQERIAERREAAEKIRADRDEAESAQQVAKLLGNLLRSDGFPRWLVASALDTLVADASRSLAELSAGQFELTHEGGEFLVIDHADADARRPVKTLSGGETFQASLALALALSAQMSGLAAKGAARLESIFLDEGFGTLDETNLEVVAGTLENLSTRGDRMVGVITHVAALAERVPVRFAVRRDQRTSSVTREGL
ncbi:SMC family ATPase, partial [Pseudonocardia alaniniphila]